MKPHHERLRILCSVFVSHTACPDSPGGTHLCNFFEEIVVHIPEERQARCKRVHVQSSRRRTLDIFEAVGQGECQLLDSCRTCFSNVISADRDRIPSRCVLCGPLEQIYNDLYRRLHRIEPGMLGHVFLQDVVLDRPPQFGDVNALPLGCSDIKAEQHRRRTVYGHRR